MRIWSYLRALRVLAAAKRSATPIVLLAFLANSLGAQQRWKIQFFYDQQDSSLDIRDIQCPSADRCVAAGVVVQKDGHQKGVLVSTSDGGQHWSMADVRENPVSLFFLNDSRSWMVTERGIWASDAGEPTWKKLDGLKGIVRVYFLDSSHGYAIGAPGAIYETADGGKKWTKLAAANVPFVDSKRTVYESIAFRGQHGMAIGQVPPEEGELLPTPSSIQRGQRSTVVVLETFDGGKSWNSRVLAFAGAVTRVSFTKDDSPVFLVEYPPNGPIGAGLIRGPLASGDEKAVFAERSRFVTDFALLPDGGAVLAAIEPPGNSSQIPIPGKLKIIESGDLKTWREKDVDYRAVAQHAVIAAVDARHQWVATDTGMILGLTDGVASDFQRKQKTRLARRVLSTPSPQ